MIRDNLSRVMRKPTFWFLTRSDTNQAVQPQMTRGLKFVYFFIKAYVVGALGYDELTKIIFQLPSNTHLFYSSEYSWFCQTAVHINYNPIIPLSVQELTYIRVLEQFFNHLLSLLYAILGTGY